MAQNVAEQLVDMLVEAGIERIYALAGDSLNELNDAIRRNGKIKWVHVRHEEVGAYAAAAEAELNGLACCAGSSGPGHVHLINGLYDANKAGASVIAFASTCPTSEFGTDYFQETNTIKLFDDCSVYNQLATTPEQLPRMLQTAIQHALYKKGVAVLGLPGDLTSKDAAQTLTSQQIFRVNPVVIPSSAELNTIADLLNSNSKVSIFCGIGASGAHDEVVQLASLLKAPVGYSFRGKMGIQYDNPYEIGMTGLLGLPSGYHALQEADIVLLLGTDFPYISFLPQEKKIIQIDLQPEKLGRRAKLAFGACGSIQPTIQALLPLIQNKTEDSFLQAQLHFYEEVKANQLTYVQDKGSEEKIHPEFVAHTIDKLATQDAIFTVDTGMCCVWGARYIQATGKRQILGSFNHGSMANALPHAIGAAFAQPGRQVIAFCGDGGISMLLGDLATVVQYKLPIKIIVFNNRSLGMVKLEMEVSGLPDNETDMYNPDFALVAAAMGMTGVTVKNPEEVEGTIQNALAQEGPVLLNILTDPNALAMPPKIEFDQVKGYAITMSKLVLSGKMDEVWDTVKSNYKHLKEVI